MAHTRRDNTFGEQRMSDSDDELKGNCSICGRPRTDCDGSYHSLIPTAVCELCGEPMPLGEQMFKFHGFSGDCPKPPLPPHDVDHSLDPVTKGDTPTTPPCIFPVDMKLSTVKDRYMLAVLKHNQFNVTHAADSLGISVRTMQRWCKKSNLSEV